jgi:hypothetical protein
MSRLDVLLASEFVLASEGTLTRAGMSTAIMVDRGF